MVACGAEVPDPDGEGVPVPEPVSVPVLVVVLEEPPETAVPGRLTVDFAARAE